MISTHNDEVLFLFLRLSKNTNKMYMIFYDITRYPEDLQLSLGYDPLDLLHIFHYTDRGYSYTIINAK